MLFLGLQEKSDATIATLKAIEHPIARQAEVLVDMCSYAGTGNVLKVQALLHQCDEHIERKDKDKEGEKEDGEKKDEKERDDTFQAFAVIGIALVAMGEDIGAEMSLRQFNHLVRILTAASWSKCLNMFRRCTMGNLLSERLFL
jgi:26S proteasome regulatory subunit N1